MSLRDQIADDLKKVVFNTDDFAIEASIKGLPVNGILDKEFVEVHDVVGYLPVFKCRTLDVTGVVQGDAVVADGVSYTVTAVQNEASGVTKLVLMEA